MSESGASRTYAIVAAVLLLPTGAFGDVAVVRGAGDPEVDLPAVQAAVDRGGKVVLLGTFDFGDGRVEIRNDVEIVGAGGGEAASDEAFAHARTTIENGDWTFFAPLPAELWPPDTATAAAPARAGPKVAIRHIRFVGARGAAVHLAYTGGCLVADNEFAAMRSRVDAPPFPPTPRYHTAVIVGPEHHFARSREPVPLLVSGDVQVLRNRMDGWTDDPTGTRSIGVFISMYVGADVVVADNHVTRFSRNGINVLDGLLDRETLRGGVEVLRNTVVSRVASGFAPGANPRAPNGILVGFNNDNDKAFAPDPGEVEVVKIRARVLDNFVELHGPGSLGIINLFNRSEIARNEVELRREPGAAAGTSIGLLLATNHQVAERNEIRGVGCNAVRVGGFTPRYFRLENLVADNDVSGFDAFVDWAERCADYRLDVRADHNTVIGRSGTFIDEGEGNEVSAPPLVELNAP